MEEFALARNWWLLALRGVLAIFFGVVAFLWPGLMGLAVVYTYAAYALVDGFFAIGMVVTGLRGPATGGPCSWSEWSASPSAC